MLRYVIIATLIVFAAGALFAAFHRGSGTVKVASVASTGSPSPPRHGAPSTFTPGPVVGDAPWAFVAVMDCFRHERTFHGPLRPMRLRVPATASQLFEGWMLESGACRAMVGNDAARVVRQASGNAAVDLTVPPHVMVFIDGGPPQREMPGRREVYVLRWQSEGDARLDHLQTMPNARAELVRL